MKVSAKLMVTDFDITQQQQLKELLQIVVKEIIKGYDNE